MMSDTMNSIKNESDINDLGETNLHLAVRNKNRDDVVKLLESGYDVNAKNNFGLTPLHYASRIEDVDILNAILSKEPNVNDKDRNNWTPLHYASYHGNEKAVEALIKHGANVNEVDSYNRTPLHIACKQGFTNVITKLLENQASFSTKDDSTKVASQYLTMQDLKQFTIDTNPDATAYKEMCDGIKTMFKNPIYSDLKFVIQSGDNQTTLNAHKSIIQARCPKLLENLNGDIVNITNISYELFHAILEFIYCASISFDNGEIDLDFAFNLAKKAGELDFQSLSQFSENMIISNLDESTVVSVLEFAESYQCCKHVESYCRYFIVKYLDKLLNSEEGNNITSEKLANIISNLPLIEQPVSQSDLIDRPPEDPFFDKSRTKPFKRDSLSSYASKFKNEASTILERPSGSDLMQGVLLESVIKMHHELMDEPEATIFNIPVDYVGLGIPDYPYIIKNPMDLGTIESKIRGNQYRTLKNYSADFRLVLDNARIYNTPDSSVYMSAVSLSEKYEERYTQLKEEMGLPLDYDKLKPKTDEYYAKTYSKGLEQYFNHNPHLRPTIPAPVVQQPVEPPKPAPQVNKTAKRKAPTPQTISTTTPTTTTQPQQQQQQAPVNGQSQKPLTQQEIEDLGERLNELDEEQVQKVIELLNVQPNEEGECEIDITNLDPETFYKLKKFIYEETQNQAKRIKTDEM